MTIHLEMVDIRGGEFMMGSDDHNCEKPIHEVKVKAFKIGKYPVTHRQYKAVMGTYSDGFCANSLHPAYRVSWTDAQDFCKKLSKLTSKIYRLPTEAEWEYACRAGTQTRYYFGDDEKLLGAHAWHRENSGLESHQVGQTKPNPWGLHDMYGNVWEWCEDIWNDNYQNAPKDGTAWNNKHSHTRVVRGGAWNDSPWFCRSASRGYIDSRTMYVGFRVVSPQDS